MSGLQHTEYANHAKACYCFQLYQIRAQIEDIIELVQSCESDLVVLARLQAAQRSLDSITAQMIAEYLAEWIEQDFRDLIRPQIEVRLQRIVDLYALVYRYEC